MALPTITAEDVKAVYPGISPDRESYLEIAILTANSIVQSSIIDCGCGSSYSDSKLKLILIYLAAHLWQSNNGGAITSISAGSTSESYQASLDTYFKGTTHGQNAMLIDTNNCLAKLMADTQMAVDGKASFTPSISTLYINPQFNRRTFF